jgi:hypothetical protein
MVSNQPTAISESEAEFYIRAAYQAFLSREADPGGLSYWSNILAQSGEPLDVISRFINSPEYRSQSVGDSGLAARVRQMAAPASASLPYGPWRLPRSGHDFRRMIGRVWWRLQHPRVRVGWEGQQALRQEQQEQKRRVALLSAWVAHLTHLQTIRQAAVDGRVDRVVAEVFEQLFKGQVDGLVRAEAKRIFSEQVDVLVKEQVDVLVKEQTAMSYRLLSIEEQLYGSSLFGVDGNGVMRAA